MGVKGAPENINLLRSSSQVKKNVPLRLTGAASGIHRYEYARIASGVPTCGAITKSTHLFKQKKTRSFTKQKRQYVFPTELTAKKHDIKSGFSGATPRTDR
jgi:hypothetical protein